MLILTRHPAALNGKRAADPDKANVVVTAPDGSRVVFRLLSIKNGNAAGVGIEAPDGWTIHRQELLTRPKPETA